MNASKGIGGLGAASDGVSSRGGGSLFHAAPPTLPSAVGLGGACLSVYDPRGRYARRMLWLLPAAALLSVLVLVVHPNPDDRYGAMAYGLALAPWFLPVIFQAARRSYEAIGEGWVYVRRTPFGEGKCILLGALMSVDLVDGPTGQATLVLTDGPGTKIKFMTSRLERNGHEFSAALAQVLLPTNVVTPRARAFLAKE